MVVYHKVKKVVDVVNINYNGDNVPMVLRNLNITQLNSHNHRKQYKIRNNIQFHLHYQDLRQLLLNINMMMRLICFRY